VTASWKKCMWQKWNLCNYFWLCWTFDDFWQKEKNCQFFDTFSIQFFFEFLGKFLSFYQNFVNCLTLLTKFWQFTKNLPIFWHFRLNNFKKLLVFANLPKLCQFVYYFFNLLQIIYIKKFDTRERFLSIFLKFLKNGLLFHEIWLILKQNFLILWAEFYRILI